MNNQTEPTVQAGTNAIHRLMNRDDVRAAAFKLRYPLSVVVLLVIAWFANPEWFWIGLGTSVVGELLQVWCFACLQKNLILTMRGPYLLVRNPMYLGRYLLILGVVILTGSWIAIAAYTVLYYLYMYNRVIREEVRLAASFGHDLQHYYSRVNRFVPGAGLFNRLDFFFFDWQLFLKNNAHWNLLSVVVMYGFIYLYLFTLR